MRYLIVLKKKIQKINQKNNNCIYKIIICHNFNGMTIGISLDEVLRDFLGKFKTIYKKEFDKDPIEPINTFEINTHFPFDTEDEMNNFLYEEFSLELFGHPNEKYKNVIIDLNSLYNQHKDEHKFIIISKEFGNSIPATLFFLSKTSCKLRDYKFVLSNSEVWEHCDIMITANPEVLTSKPKDKITIKIKCDYNSDIKSDYEVEKIKNILDENLLSNISNTKIISYTKIEE